MLLPVPNVLTAAQVARARELFAAASWVDGRVTAGHQSALAKQNRQLAESDPAARELGEMIVAALGANPLFLAAALPAKVFPPLFNRYEGGESFGTHIDNAIRQVTGTTIRVRTDLSATLFFSSPDEYDGGELVVEEYSGAHQVKLPAGHLILYPAQQPPSRPPRDARDAPRVFLLDPEHGPRRGLPPDTLRSGPRDSGRQPRARGLAGGDLPDRRLPQPPPALGRRLAANLPLPPTGGEGRGEGAQLLSPGLWTPSFLEPRPPPPTLVRRGRKRRGRDLRAIHRADRVLRRREGSDGDSSENADRRWLGPSTPRRRAGSGRARFPENGRRARSWRTSRSWSCCGGAGSD